MRTESVQKKDAAGSSLPDLRVLLVPSSWFAGVCLALFAGPSPDTGPRVGEMARVGHL